MIRKVLIVDDDADILQAVKELLEMEGYEVQALHRCEETVTVCQRFQPDIILLDLLLSGSDGRSIAQALKKQRGTRHVPIVMMSAHPGAAQYVEQSYVSAFIAKPFDSQALLNLLAAQQAA